MGKRISEEVRREIADAVGDGRPVRDVAAEFDVSISTVSVAARKFGVNLDGSQVANAVNSRQAQKALMQVADRTSTESRKRAEQRSRKKWPESVKQRAIEVAEAEGLRAAAAATGVPYGTVGLWMHRHRNPITVTVVGLDGKERVRYVATTEEAEFLRRTATYARNRLRRSLLAAKWREERAASGELEEAYAAVRRALSSLDKEGSDEPSINAAKRRATSSLHEAEAHIVEALSESRRSW